MEEMQRREAKLRNPDKKAKKNKSKKSEKQKEREAKLQKETVSIDVDEENY